MNKSKRMKISTIYTNNSLEDGSEEANEANTEMHKMFKKYT